MSYLKLIGARRRSGKTPTMTPHRLTREQQALAAKGRCIACADADAGKNSYLCADCEAKHSMEEIRDEITALRRQILNKPDA